MKQGIIVMVCLGVFACAPMRQVDYDYDKTVAFNELKTFAWMPQPPAPYKDTRYRNEIIEANIKNYVTQQFTGQGMVLNNKNPDVLLTYELQVEKGEYLQEQPIYAQPPVAPMMVNPMWNNNMHFQFWNGPMMMNNMWMPPPPQIVGYRTRKIPFKDGTLVVSAHKRVDNRLIWRGWAVSCIMNPTEYKQNLEDKTADLVRTYPKNKGRR